MEHQVALAPDPAAAASMAAAVLAEQVRAAVESQGSFSLAVSGGRSPWRMLEDLATMDLPWRAVSIWQVDERVAPADDPDRNLVGLRRAIGTLPVSLHPMPVEDLNRQGDDRDDHRAREACDRYSATLPESFDLIHLGLGPDGHTASLVPDDGILDVSDRAVAVTTGDYQGRRRMSLTYPALARTRSLLWLVTGADKREALAGLLRGDPALPASKVTAPRSVIFADAAATGP